MTPRTILDRALTDLALAIELAGIAAKLRAARRERPDPTIRDLARRLQVSQSSKSDWENAEGHSRARPDPLPEDGPAHRRALGGAGGKRRLATAMRNQRIESGATKQQTANELGMTRVSLNRLELAHCRPLVFGLACWCARPLPHAASRRPQPAWQRPAQTPRRVQGQGRSAAPVADRSV